MCAGRETSPTSFLCRLTSVVPAPPAEIANLMSWNYLGTLSKVTDYSHEGVSVGSPFYSVVVSPHCSQHDGFTVGGEIGTLRFSSRFFFVKLVLAALGPLHFLTN